MRVSVVAQTPGYYNSQRVCGWGYLHNDFEGGNEVGGQGGQLVPLFGDPLLSGPHRPARHRGPAPGQALGHGAVRGLPSRVRAVHPTFEKWAVEAARVVSADVAVLVLALKTPGNMNMSENARNSHGEGTHTRV